MNQNLDKEYWDTRYIENQTAWDASEITTPLKEYFDQLTNKDMKILIPGAGNAYEAEYLFNQGFSDITVVDISKKPLDNLQARVTGFPSENLICEDFFSHEGNYQLIIEQTFFCALNPSLRESYVQKMASLLMPGGKLVGVLFNCEFEGGPPFGGNKDEYLVLFQPFFNIKTFETCYNSIKPRSERELFVILERL